MAHDTWETCSKVIQSEVTTLQMELQRLLGDNLLGIYLHGSLALGGFQPERSDIDVIVLTAQRIDLETKRQCIELLLRISKMPCPLDIRFLVQHDLFPFRHPLLCDLHFRETHRESYQQELQSGTWKDWDRKAQLDPDLTLHLTVLHHSGICLYGKPIAEVLPLVPEHDFRDALIKDVQVAQGDPLHDPISFVLNACRACAYLRDGAILSKDAGGVWGLAHLPEQYHPLIQQALALYRGERLGRPVGHAAWDAFAASMREAIRL
ncbi:MAG: aminoglycoside adenylyltransferase domain-containing protein [Ktedonobacteraceae bacterium]